MTDDRLMITPRGISLELVAGLKMIMPVVELGTEHKDGDASSELLTHLAVYASRQDANFVAHVHSPHATTASCMARTGDLPRFHYYQAVLGDYGTPVLPFYMPGSAELAQRVGALLSYYDHDTVHALLLANHGALVWAHDLHRLTKRIQVLEDICRIYVQSGGWPNEITAVGLSTIRHEVFDGA